MSAQWRKMLASELYDPIDTQRVLARRRVCDLLVRFNRSADEERGPRRTICREPFGSIGNDLLIEPPFHCGYGVHIHLGDRVFFNFNCVISAPAEVRIGDDVSLGAHVRRYAATRPIRRKVRRTGLGMARLVAIGAGSVVTKDLPADAFAAGNPCRVLHGLDGEDPAGRMNV